MTIFEDAIMQYPKQIKWYSYAMTNCYSPSVAIGMVFERDREIADKKMDILINSEYKYRYIDHLKLVNQKKIEDD